MRGHLRITHEYHGEKFTVMKDGVRWFTPLFLVLMLIETSDVIFAVDSIPAIFAVTTDPFIVFTSNIFAIMGLRSLYFLLADLNGRFHLLKYGLAMVLVFVGTKMLIVDFYKVPIGLALGVVALISRQLRGGQPVRHRKRNRKESTMKHIETRAGKTHLQQPLAAGALLPGPGAGPGPAAGEVRQGVPAFRAPGVHRRGRRGHHRRPDPHRRGDGGQPADHHRLRRLRELRFPDRHRRPRGPARPGWATWASPN
jgi:hypothetical protein